MNRMNEYVDMPTGYFQLEMNELYVTERMNMFFITRKIEIEHKDIAEYILPPKNLPYYRKFEKRSRF